MNTNKKVQVGLLAALIGMAIGARAWIWDIIKPWPKAWKIVAAVLIGLFTTLLLVHGLDLLPEFLSIFNINILL